MALSRSSVFEVRPSAGSDTNGGGFDPTVTSPGTDFSQQNSAQQAYTDLVAASGTTITSVARPFSSVDVGNFIQIVSGTGWTTGTYCIISVSGVTATMDRTIATGGSTGGHGNLGGAYATISAFYAVSAQGFTAYVKATATITTTSAQTLSTTSDTPITLIGYTTTRGDGGQVTWTTSTNSINLIVSDGYNYAFENFIFSSTAGTPGDGFHALTGTSSLYKFKNCKIAGFARGINGRFSVDWNINCLMMDNCEVTACTVAGIANEGQMHFTGCYIHDNTGDGVTTDTTSNTSVWVFNRCVIKSNTGKGINYGNQGGPNTSSYAWPVLYNCAILNNGSDGILINGNSSSSPPSLLCWNTIIDGNGGYGVNLFGSSPQSRAFIDMRCNAYRNNTSGTSNFPTLFAGTGDVTLTGDPFVNRAGGDFNLNSTAGAGAACKAAGFESTLLG